MTTFYRQGFLACTGFKVVVQLVAPFRFYKVRHSAEEIVVTINCERSHILRRGREYVTLLASCKISEFYLYNVCFYT